MLLELKDLILEFGLKITGVLHVGACRCEELPIYNACGIQTKDVVWLEANPSIVGDVKRANPAIQIYQSVLSDKDNESVSFMVTNNEQSSSILPFGKHAEYHPWVVATKHMTLTTSRLDTFAASHGIKGLNFLNMDIQGAELLALKGATQTLQGIDYVYVEVNDQELYKGCGEMFEIDALLEPMGFVRVKTKMTDAHWGDALYIKSVTKSISSGNVPQSSSIPMVPSTRSEINLADLD